ncbi:MAG: metal-dependent transcriptional regulator [Anaerolineales bacterium]
MKSTHLTPSIQDYLKRIFELSREGRPASTNDLAGRLGVKPASVTGMVQKLASARPPLVEYHKHQGVTLTKAGERAALEVIRHHRLLETWLVQALGYRWDEVHEEACRLEHVISEEFETRVAAALGEPTYDPHGEPIPASDLSMPPDTSEPLSSLRPPHLAVVQRVSANDPAFLRHLDDLGLIPGAFIEVVSHSPFDGNLTVRLGNRIAILGTPITENIFVEVRE